VLSRVPWWLDEAPPDPEAEPLSGEAEADVAIVGGGYTGLWTALELKRRAPTLRVTVLEAEHVGYGPSGRNGGFLETYWSTLPRLRSRLGDEASLALARASEGAIPAVEALGEDVWLRTGGMLEVSTTPAQDAAVEEGISPVFRLGVRFTDAATVQPARLVRALRRAAVGDGVVLHERFRVTSIRPGEVVTATARLRAPEVVVAANAWMSGWRPASRALTLFGSYVALTEPVPELLGEIGWTGGEAITDGRTFLHYFRTTEDGRVLMGSASGPATSCRSSGP
jgi:glycine/D-amino acid oxidase-like deaminating enzyme